MNSRLLCIALIALLEIFAVRVSAENSELAVDHALTAEISGFRKNWDTPVAQGGEGAAGTLVFDAVNRSLLVRFPEAAKMIIDRLNAGWKIDKAELVLDWSAYEMRPADYARTSGQRWRERPPRWHALAWALRRPWMPDAALGPTFNAYVNGLGYWSSYGAQDTERDRYPAQLGPAELSEVQREGRIDITAVLTDATYGQSVADRLRLPAEQGFLVRKWEVYDARYNFGGYDVDSMTGQCGIMVARPRLVVAFSKAEGEQRYAPPKPRDFAQLVAELRAKPDGKPTAVVMSEAEFARVSEEFRFKQPDWMPDWQWQRVQELYALGGRVFEIPDTYTEYLEWVDRIIASPPRRWTGWDIVDNLTDVLHYRDLLPAPALDAVKLDWWAWTYPDRDWRELEHNQSIDLFHGGRQAYYEQTGDWRGNSSFFRESYTRYMATMNMNHTGVAGALLGGALLGSEHAVADGRFGLEYYPLRLWAWYDGTMQEALDHYYFALTLGGEKSFVDCGPTHYDRLLGKSTLRKSMEELVSAWHPGLRHFIATSSRTGIAYTQVIQEGTAHIIHTMSRKGALHDVNNPDRSGMPVSGSDLPARRVALKTLTGAWAPEWMANIVDDKPLPYEVTAAFRYWGYYYDAPLWKRSYLGNHYGVASLDIAHEESVPVLAQWKRVDRPLETVQDLGTLLVRYGMNDTDFLRSRGGFVGLQGGGLATLQHKNKLVVLASPYPDLKTTAGRRVPENITSLQTAIGLLNLQAQPAWKIYVDADAVKTLPFSMKMGQRITIQDGPAYVGIIPIPAADLGRTDEVILKQGQSDTRLQGGGRMAVALEIDAFNYRSGKPLDRALIGSQQLDAAYGGFVIELGDATEYPSFAAFQKHLQECELEAKWQQDEGILHVRYHSGQDTMEVGYRPAIASTAIGEDTATFAYRRVNGEWPYLPPGLLRDTTLSQQGESGRLEKRSAVLQLEPGAMGYLQVEPVSGTYVAANPLPDPTWMTLDTPEGVRLEADGKLSLTYLTMRPKERALWIDTGQGDVDTPGLAGALIISGLREAPAVYRNGTRMTEPIASADAGGRRVCVVPLDGRKALEPEAVLARFRQQSAAREAAMHATLEASAAFRFEKGQDYAQAIRPKGDWIEFHKQWPGMTAFDVRIAARIGGRIVISADGRLGLMHVAASPEENAIVVEYPSYVQKDVPDKASFLLVFGCKTPPTVDLNGKRFAGQPLAVSVNGEPAFAYPLFPDLPQSAGAGIPERYRKAMDILAAGATSVTR